MSEPTSKQSLTVQSPAAEERMNWNPIRKACIEASEALGHKLSGFKSKRSSPSFKMASCEICGGCCWIGFKGTGRGFNAGGRLLIYQCGTPEAAGFLRAALPDQHGAKAEGSDKA